MTLLSLLSIALIPFVGETLADESGNARCHVPDVRPGQSNAPILWFAGDEPIYPTIPHPFAFDNKDNDGDGLVDFADCDEVDLDTRTPLEGLLAYQPRRASWTARPAFARMKVLYHGPDLFAGTVPVPDVVLAELMAGSLGPVSRDALRQLGIRIAPPTAVRRSGDQWRFDTVDEGATREVVVEDRAGSLIAIRGPRGITRSLSANIYLHQYWFYYLYDRGIGAHRHDSEHAFVFTTGGPRGPVKAVVGAGHTPETANNILVASPVLRSDTRDFIFPGTLNRHPVILVELGKHASAPDRNFDGKFDIGLDANLYAENTWGSRDAQTGLVGKAKVGRFQSWLSFPRDAVARWSIERNAQLKSYLPTELMEASEDAAVAGEAVPEQAKADRVARTPPGQRFTQLFNEARADPASQYELFPLDAMRELYRLAGDRRTTPDAMGRFLEANATLFWDCRDAPKTVEVCPRALEGMRAWTDRLDAKRDPWEHHDFKDPAGVFKLGLFPAIAAGITTRRDGSDSVTGLSLQFAGLRGRYFSDSTLKFTLLWDAAFGTPVWRRPVYGCTLEWELFRGSFRGAFLGAGVDGRRRVFGKPDGEAEIGNRSAYGSVTAGYAWSMPLSSALAKLFGWLAPGWEPTGTSPRLTGSVGIRTWVLGNSPGDDRIASSLGLHLMWGVKAPRHPLTY
jgi:hypothetical protein